MYVRGGIGYLVNALRDDPDIAGCGAVGVVLGGNDITNSEAASDAEFVYTIDKGVGRLKEELDKYGSKTLAVFSPPPGPNEDPWTAHRAKYLSDALETIRGENKSTHVLPPEVSRDDGGHPTVEGTKTLLQYVKDEVKPDLIFREELMVTERLYAGVQSVYCYGCRTCGKVGQFPGKVGICPTCQDGVGQCDGGGGELDDFRRLSSPSSAASASGGSAVDRPQQLEGRGRRRRCGKAAPSR